MFFCPDCHVSNRSDAKFCRKCGKSRVVLERSEQPVLTQKSEHESNQERAQGNGQIQAVEGSAVSASVAKEVLGTAVHAADSAPDASDSGSFRADMAPHAADSRHEEHSVPQTTHIQRKVIDLTDQGADAASEVSPPVEENLSPAEGAPPLAVRIEQKESFNVPVEAPPQCPKCWETLRATDKFCCWCGEAQPNRILPFMKLCLECSTFLPEKANYCYSCGTDVGYTSRRKVRVPHELFKDEESEFFPRFDA